MKNIKTFELYSEISNLSDEDRLDIIKKQEKDAEKDELKSYIDMFYHDDYYSNLTFEERYTQICNDFIMTSDMKDAFKKMVFKNTYESKKIKTYRRFFEAVNLQDVQKIVNTLHQLSIMFETYHHNTKSTSKHNAIDQAHEMYSDIKDDLIEKIIGYTGLRYEKTEIETIEYSIENLDKFPDFIINFSKTIEDFAISNKYGDIGNIAQELGGIGAKLSYLLTLNNTNESKINETGEWTSGVDYEYAKANRDEDDDECVLLILGMEDCLNTVINLVHNEDSTIDISIEDIKGFDMYQGCYAKINIEGDMYKVWRLDDYVLYIENFIVNNNSENENTGFTGNLTEVSKMILKYY
jgi:hypothetical protein